MSPDGGRDCLPKHVAYMGNGCQKIYAACISRLTIEVCVIEDVQLCLNSKSKTKYLSYRQKQYYNIIGILL